jgi:hypothetical protein
VIAATVHQRCESADAGGDGGPFEVTVEDGSEAALVSLLRLLGLAMTIGLAGGFGEAECGTGLQEAALLTWPRSHGSASRCRGRSGAEFRHRAVASVQRGL